MHQQLERHEAVVEDEVGAAQALGRAERQQTRMAWACADQGNRRDHHTSTSSSVSDSCSSNSLLGWNLIRMMPSSYSRHMGMVSISIVNASGDGVMTAANTAIAK